MPKQRMRCPKCRHEFVAETPDREGKFIITCPECNFRSTVTIRPPMSMPSAIIDSEAERRARERGGSQREASTPPFSEVTDAPFQRSGASAPLARRDNVQPRPGDLAGEREPERRPPDDDLNPPLPEGARKVTMKPLTRKVKPKGRWGRRRREAPPEVEPRGREGDAVRAMVPPVPSVVVTTVDAAIENGQLTFHARWREGRMSGVQRSPEMVSFTPDHGEGLTIEIIDPHVAVFRFIGQRNEMLAFMYEKLTGAEKTLFLQFPDGRILTMWGHVESGPGGYRFDLRARDDLGGEVGRCDGRGKGFEGSGRFEGEIGDVRVAVGTLAALHLIGSLNE
ncbi:MAG: hypothetical protein L0Z54_02890 [Thermoplasmata archaeon]|nr:hypothetical protein [Thermoplasmata archaeon]